MRYSPKNILGELRLWLCNHLVNKIPSHTIRLCYYRAIMGFRIGKGSSIHLGCHFNVKGGLAMGTNSTINMNCHIDTRGEIVIGNNVSISPYVSLVTADHDLNDPSFSGREGKIVLEDFVFVGYRAIVLKGVTMKKGSVLGAGSVLAKDTAEMGIYMGMPAQLVKQRNAGLDYTVRYDRLFH